MIHLESDVDEDHGAASTRDVQPLNGAATTASIDQQPTSYLILLNCDLCLNAFIVWQSWPPHLTTTIADPLPKLNSEA